MTEANIYGYSYYTTATKQLYVDGTTTTGDRYWMKEQKVCLQLAQAEWLDSFISLRK